MMTRHRHYMMPARRLRDRRRLPVLILVASDDAKTPQRVANWHQMAYPIGIARKSYSRTMTAAHIAIASIFKGRAPRRLWPAGKRRGVDDGRRHTARHLVARRRLIAAIAKAALG